jgi:predicted unusual protein kinase regulating ubiquinone biosynthesis (AarF/ABC1/UbiB family)
MLTALELQCISRLTWLLHLMSLLQDDVPPFSDEEAFSIIQAQLGRPLEAVFSSISEQPVAAASLGQVCVQAHGL